MKISIETLVSLTAFFYLKNNYVANSLRYQMDTVTGIMEISCKSRTQTDEMEEISDSIRRDTFLVFILSNIIGTFPYNVRLLKFSKLHCLWSVIVFGSLFRLLSIAYMDFQMRSDLQGMAFYNVLMTRFLVIALTMVCSVLFYSLFTMSKNLRAIFMELNRIQSFFYQLSCLDAVPK